MILKYEIYFETKGNDLRIYQLVPERRSWRLHLPEGDEPAARELMRVLARGIEDAALSEVLSKMPPSCGEITDFLKSKKLFSAMDHTDFAKSPFLRQIEVFDSWNRGNGSPEAFQESLADATVFVIGAGGVGSNLCDLLASCGCGQICVVDFDIIELHNLARQRLYTRADLGLLKSEVLAKRLSERGLSTLIPLVERLTPRNVQEVIAKCGHVDIATGWPFPRSPDTVAIIEKILDLGIPYLCVGEHDCGPLLRSKNEIPEFRKWFSERFKLNDIWFHVRNLRGGDMRHPSYAPVIQIACAIAADEVVRVINNYGPTRSSAGVYSIDPLTSEVRIFRKG